MNLRLLGTPSGFLAVLVSELQPIVWFCKLWQFLANYVSTLADRMTKWKREQLYHGTRKGAKVEIGQRFRPDMLSTEGRTDGQTDAFTDTECHLAARRSNRIFWKQIYTPTPETAHNPIIYRLGRTWRWGGIYPRNICRVPSLKSLLSFTSLHGRFNALLSMSQTWRFCKPMCHFLVCHPHLPINISFLRPS